MKLLRKAGMGIGIALLFTMTAYAEAPVQESSAMVNIVRFLGLAIGFLAAFAAVRAVTRAAERNRTDIPQPTMLKSKPTHTPVPVLLCESGPLSGKSWPLEKEELTIGRDDSCTVRYPKDTRSVSPLHCRLVPGADGCRLTDEGSSAGTFLEDGTRLNAGESVVLAMGSRFTLGEKHHSFRIALQ